MSPCFFSLSSRPQDMDQRRGAERSLQLLIPSRYRRGVADSSPPHQMAGEEREEEGRGGREAGREAERRQRGALCHSGAQGHTDRQTNSSLCFPHSPLGAFPSQHPSQKVFLFSQQAAPHGSPALLTIPFQVLIS